LTAGERLGRRGQARTVRREKDEQRIDNLIVIGTSAGGHRALAELFKDFSEHMPAAIVILLHMPKTGASAFKTMMGRFSRLPIIEVMDHEPLRQGVIFVPSPGHSAILAHGTIRVDRESPDRPVNTINRTFASAAQTYGRRVIGVVLTGFLKDGTDGLRAVHEAGGLTIVQDPSEAEFPDMPRSAMARLPVTFCLSLAEIGPALELLVRRTAQFETGLAVAVRTLRDRAALLLRLDEQSWRNPETREFLRHELFLLRRDVQSIDDLVKASVAEHA
jgi:two-component system chemotaxis response regulator CheB